MEKQYYLMGIKRIAKAVAKPFQQAWRWRQLNADITAIKLGPKQKAYPLDWQRIRGRYLGSEEPLKAFLKRAGKVKYEGGPLGVVCPVVPMQTREKIEFNMGLPRGIIATQIELEKRRVMLKQHDKKLKQKGFSRDVRKRRIKNMANKQGVPLLEAELQTMISFALQDARASQRR